MEAMAKHHTYSIELGQNYPHDFTMSHSILVLTFRAGIDPGQIRPNPCWKNTPLSNPRTKKIPKMKRSECPARHRDGICEAVYNAHLDTRRAASARRSQRDEALQRLQGRGAGPT